MNTYLKLTKDHENLSLKNSILDPAQKRKFLGGIVDRYKMAFMNEKRIEYNHFFEHYYREETFVGETKTFTLKSVSPIVIGRGTPSVLESNLNIHKIYGVPYLNATAIKGVGSHYRRQVLSQIRELYPNEFDLITRIMGTEEQAGFVCFHDAFPTPETVAGALNVDVITPHHKSYDSSDFPEAPRDDESPVPLPFLTMCADFKVVLSSSHENAKEWLDLAEGLIHHALEQKGIGGYTSYGYGLVKKEEV